MRNATAVSALAYAVVVLLRRLLALSCDRHMRNATAVSALICGMCEGAAGAWPSGRRVGSLSAVLLGRERRRVVVDSDNEEGGEC